MKTTILCIILTCLAPTLFAQEQPELFIIGSMHTVPSIVKNSYAPLLKKAQKYAPEAIYVEKPMPNDSISWGYLKDSWYKKFYALSDSLQKFMNYDTNKTVLLLQKNFSELTADDLDSLIILFAYLRDLANYQFYSYVKKYGVQGSKKALRYEDYDLTFKLALRMDIKQLIGVDCQHNFLSYNESIKKCSHSKQDSITLRKLNRKDYNSAIIPSVFGNFGKHINSQKSLQRLHLINSVRYMDNPNGYCLEATKLWDERNNQIAQNITAFIKANQHKRNVLIIGAGHVVGIKEALNKLYPDLKIILIDEE